MGLLIEIGISVDSMDFLPGILRLSEDFPSHTAHIFLDLMDWFREKYRRKPSFFPSIMVVSSRFQILFLNLFNVG